MDTSSHRACSHCRAQKVRCIPEPSTPNACQKCRKAGRECIFTPLQRRKQRKRTDTRVAELEREMRAMRAILKPKTASDIDKVIPVREESAEGFWEDEINLAGADERPLQPSQPIEDIVERGLLDMATATNLLASYKSILVKQYPMVPLAADYTAERLRIEKPVLFVAVMAAAATQDMPDLSKLLDTAVAHIYAQRVILNSEKSLELIQALLISAAWYSPPEKFGQLRYYKYIHMANVMSMELGIATRPPKIRRERPHSNGHPIEDARNPDLSMAARSQDQEQDPATTEARRTLLAVFNLCTSCAASLRRPTMLRPSKYIKECVDQLETAVDGVFTDGMLIAWTRLYLIVAEYSEALSFDDPEQLANLADLRTQVMLKDYARRLTLWETSVLEEHWLPSLKFTYYFCRMALFELVLHIDHSPEDFKAPYQMGGVQPSREDDLPTQILVDCISECTYSAHQIMETYLSLRAEDARAVPVISAVRISFAAFILAKLCLSSMSKESRIAGLIDRNNLKAEYYMDKMILHARDVLGNRGRRVSGILMALLFKVRQWCANPSLIPDQSKVIDRQDGEDLRKFFNYSQTGGIAGQSALQDHVNALHEGSISESTTTSNLDMDLDQDFFNFLDDVNTFQGGSDWAAFPNQVDGIIGSTNWSNG